MTDITLDLRTGVKETAWDQDESPAAPGTGSLSEARLVNRGILGSGCGPRTGSALRHAHRGPEARKPSQWRQVLPAPPPLPPTPYTLKTREKPHVVAWVFQNTVGKIRKRQCYREFR